MRCRRPLFFFPGRKTIGPGEQIARPEAEGAENMELEAMDTEQAVQAETTAGAAED